MTDAQIFAGLGLIFLLALLCQVAASRFRLPAILLYLPVGFAAGNLTTVVDPNAIFGSAFSPLVNLAVAVVIFDAGLELVFGEIEHPHHHRVVRRLLFGGVPLTWAGAGLLAWWLLGLSWETALMLGVILVVSGPTVVGPLLRSAHPGQRVTAILGWEATIIDPVGALLGVLVFHSLLAGTGPHALGVGQFALRLGLGAVTGAAGVAILWLLLRVMRLTGYLAADAILATVVGMAALSDAVRADTGLVTALVIGVTLANVPGFQVQETRQFREAVVQMAIGLLFVSIAATVTAASLTAVLWPTLALIAGLILLVRPAVAALATAGTSLTRGERVFIGAMDPRGIVAAVTAASFSASLAAAGIDGAHKLLPVTFLVIVGTVLVYGLSAVPLARRLGLG
jgi:NhaP-type Na+/H+ or K+/H+ antiporter